MLTSASSTRGDGNMSFNWGDNNEVEHNRLAFLQKYGVSLYDGILMNTVDHSDRWLAVDANDRGRGIANIEQAPRVDALITTTKNLPLFLLTADCYSVLLYDKSEEIMALIHLGWRGVDKYLVQKVIKQMVGMAGIKARDILVKLGPGAKPESYVVESPSQLSSPNWQPYLKRATGNNYQVDLPGFITRQCQDEGVLSQSINITNIDTISNQNQFSHYRAVRSSEREGRLLTVAML